jgi:hypothetical protein
MRAMAVTAKKLDVSSGDVVEIAARSYDVVSDKEVGHARAGHRQDDRGDPRGARRASAVERGVREAVRDPSGRCTGRSPGPAR